MVCSQVLLHKTFAPVVYVLACLADMLCVAMGCEEKSLTMGNRWKGSMSMARCVKKMSACLLAGAVYLWLSSNQL